MPSRISLEDKNNDIENLPLSTDHIVAPPNLPMVLVLPSTKNYVSNTISWRGGGTTEW